MKMVRIKKDGVERVYVGSSSVTLDEDGAVWVDDKFVEFWPTARPGRKHLSKISAVGWLMRTLTVVGIITLVFLLIHVALSLVGYV